MPVAGYGFVLPRAEATASFGAMAETSQHTDGSTNRSTARFQRGSKWIISAGIGHASTQTIWKPSATQRTVAEDWLRSLIGPVSG